MRWSAEEALEHWQKEKLLTPKEADSLLKNLQKAEDHVPGKSIVIFSILGAVLIGLGIILFVASNWQNMEAWMKVGILITATVATAAVGFRMAEDDGRYPKVGYALLFLNVLIYGATIFLVAQIYHLPLTLWWGALLWCIGTIVPGLILRAKLHTWLAIPIFVLFLGWLRTAGITGFSAELDFLFNERQTLLPYLPALGVGLMSLGILARGRKNLEMHETPLYHWGLFLMLFPLVISTADRWFFFQYFTLEKDLMGFLILAGSFLAFAFAASFGRFQVRRGTAGLLLLMVYVAIVYILAGSSLWIAPYPDYTILAENLTLRIIFVTHILLLFTFLIGLIWFGTLLHRPVVINLGMTALALAILIQYVSFGFSMQNRSFFFMGGGVLILLISTLLEKQRRTLLATFQ